MSERVSSRPRCNPGSIVEPFRKVTRGRPLGQASIVMGIPASDLPSVPEGEPRGRRVESLTSSARLRDTTGSTRCGVLNGPPPERRPRRRRPRRPTYPPKVISILTMVWEAAGYPWSVRLKALLPVWLPWVRKHLLPTPRMEEPASPDQPHGRWIVVCGRRRSGRDVGFMDGPSPGPLLKHHVPIKTDRWDVKRTGVYRDRLGEPLR